MRKLFSNIFLVIIVVSNCAVANTRLEAVVSPVGVTWKNADSSYGFVASSGFTPVPNLVATKSWTPGIARNSHVLILNDEYENSVSVDIEELGMEYEFSSNSGATSKDNILGNYSSCYISKQTAVSSYIVTQPDTACLSNKSIMYDSSNQPFYYVRPIVKLNDSTIISAFKNKPSGIYRGVLPIKYFYGYKNANGIFTYRRLSTQLLVKINYRSSDINKVTITPATLDLIPDYDQGKQMISSSGDINITVDGEIASGLVLYIPDNDYALESGVSSSIPLTIECFSCEAPSLVVSGKRLTEKTRITATGSSVRFDLNFSYQDIPFSSVADGTYSNNFTFILEASY